MLARLSVAIVAALALAAPGPVSADHYSGHSGNVYGPKNGTGTNFYGKQPNGGSDPWNQPRPPTLQNQWEQPRGTNVWEQPRKPDLDPWGKPKY